MDKFYPDIYVKDVYTIDYKKLKENGITTLLFDLDNTLAPFDIEYPSDNVKELINNLTNDGFFVTIVSNNELERVEKFCKNLSVKTLHKAGKPKTSKIKNLLNEENRDIKTCAIVGDQLFTDMWVGSKLGITKILVEPIANRDEFTVKLKRGLEKIVFKPYLKKNNIEL